MPISRADAQQAGRIGGLTRAALAPDPQSITRAASDASWEIFRQRVRDVMPEVDEAEIDIRAERLRKAEMTRLSMKAARARRLRRELGRLEADLSAGDAPAEAS